MLEKLLMYIKNLGWAYGGLAGAWSPQDVAKNPEKYLPGKRQSVTPLEAMQRVRGIGKKVEKTGVSQKDIKWKNGKPMVGPAADMFGAKSLELVKEPKKNFVKKSYTVRNLPRIAGLSGDFGCCGQGKMLPLLVLSLIILYFMAQNK